MGNQILGTKAGECSRLGAHCGSHRGTHKIRPAVAVAVAGAGAGAGAGAAAAALAVTLAMASTERRDGQTQNGAGRGDAGRGGDPAPVRRASPSRHSAQPGQRAKEVVKPAYKPGSVEDSHSSRQPVARLLKQPTREQREPRQRSPIWSCSGWGFTCRFRYRLRGALLPHLFTLAVGPGGPLGRSESLYHFPWPRDLRPLAGIPLCGARTFLPGANTAATVQPTSPPSV